MNMKRLLRMMDGMGSACLFGQDGRELCENTY